MTLVTYSDTHNPTGLAAAPLRPRRTWRARIDRFVTRLQLHFALWSIRTDVESIPTFLLSDVGIPADDLDRIVQAATRLTIRSAVRLKLDRLRRARFWSGRWTS